MFIEYHIQLIKRTVYIAFQDSVPSFENSVDPDQLASEEAS